ncbi:MAG: TonB-dependent receptor plug domain-containing protein [Rhodospirillaceae bacterium]
MYARAYRPALVSALALPLLVPGVAEGSDFGSIADLKNLSIEELAGLEVSSVSKRVQPISDAAAAVYVITNDDIVRSGAATIPEMLRLAPNLDVAQINASEYAISSRGFNNNIADKLLVLIDGRSVYTPIFAGVYWDMQYVPRQDIERIEVISGPGGTLWGANAVNGVINIITRSSRATQGGVVDVGFGNQNRLADIQYGGRINEGLTYRLYGDFSAILHNDFADGTSAGDGWQKGQGGFRADWSRDRDLITLQGDLFDGRKNQAGPNDPKISGGNLLTRWTHDFAGGSALQIQAYYDEERRTSPGGAAGEGNYLTSYDIDAQYSFDLNSWNSVVLGGGKRIDEFRLEGQPAFFFNPGRDTLHYWNVFAEDTISLTDTLRLMAGVKIEKDAYVGVQPLPSVRLSWKFAPTHMLWAAVSRAVRAPTPFDRTLQAGGPPALLVGGANFQSEKLVAYEAGYRGQPTDDTSLSISGYYNRYTSMRSEGFTATFFPIEFTNTARGETYGVEVWGSYTLADWWTLAAGFKVRDQDLVFDIPISNGPLADFERQVAPLLVSQAIGFTGNDTSHQFSVRSSMVLPHDVTLDAEVRKVGALPNPALPSYVELTARIGWKITDDLRLALLGANMLHARHVEFVANGPAVHLKRSVMLRAQRTF